MKEVITLFFTLILFLMPMEAMASNIPMPGQPGDGLVSGLQAGANIRSNLMQQQLAREQMRIEQERFRLEQERMLFQQRLWNAQMQLIEKETDPAKKLALIQSLLERTNG